MRKSAIMQRPCHLETFELINLIVYKINFLVPMYVSYHRFVVSKIIYIYKEIFSYLLYLVRKS